MKGQIGHYSTSYTYLHFSLNPIASQAEFKTTDKLCDISGYPALGSAPESHDRGTLSSNAMGYVPGMIKLDSLAFMAQYDVNQYAKLKQHEDQYYYFQCGFGKNGEYGVWQWYGTYSVTVGEGEVDAVRGTMTITFYVEVNDDGNGIEPILPEGLGEATKIGLSGFTGTGVSANIKYATSANATPTSLSDQTTDGEYEIGETGYVQIRVNLPASPTSGQATAVTLSSISVSCDSYSISETSNGGFIITILGLKNSPTITIGTTLAE